MRQHLPDWWFDEPAQAGAALVILVNSILALAVALGWWQLDAIQLALVYLVVLNAVVFIVGRQVRGLISPTGRDPIDPGE